MKVYGVSVSYYTGKLEAYLRYKGIPYTMDSPYRNARRIKPHAVLAPNRRDCVMPSDTGLPSLHMPD